MFNPLDHLPQAQKDLIAATEAREAREFEAEQAERQDQAWAAARMARHYEDLRVWQTGHTTQEWQASAQNAAVVREARNAASEYGSPERPFGMWTGADGAVHRFEPRELAAGPARADSPEEQLARARANPPEGRAFMEAEIRRFDARQRSAGKPVISRSQTPETVSCTECIAADVTVDEYLELHHGDDPLPETHVPDHAPATRKRSGLARTPMIYR